MSREWLSGPCWVLRGPDGEVGIWQCEDEWFDTHYGSEIAARGDALDAVEQYTDPDDSPNPARADRARSARPVQVARRCFTLVCDVCGTEWDPDEQPIHYHVGDPLPDGWTTDGDRINPIHHCPTCPPVPGLNPEHQPGPLDVPLFDLPAVSA